MEKSDTIFKTQRLFARPFTADDLDDVFKVNSNPEVMKHIGPVESREDAQKYLDDCIEYYKQDPGFGKFAVCLRKTGEFVGWVILKNLDKTDIKEVGYRLLQKHWAKGYDTEIAEGALEYGFWEMELPKIAAVTMPDNVGSIKVLESLEFRFKRIAKFYDTELSYFVLQKDQWERAV
jgi:RimJ/RimL family protein N-acetyltransferase